MGSFGLNRGGGDTGVKVGKIQDFHTRLRSSNII